MIAADRALARILKQEGVEQIFCFPTSEMIEAAATEGIRIITARTERVVANMADAYTRINNGKKIGVCAVQAGPGTEAVYVSVAQAYADSSPILILTDGATNKRMGLPSLSDTVNNFKPVTKWATSVNSADRISEIAARVFTHLRNGRRRPVLLELPRDVAGAEVDEAKQTYVPTRSYKSAGDPADVANAAKLLREAKKPIFYVGQGVVWGEGAPELLELAELVGVPVMTTTMAKGVFPEDHALALGIGGNEITGMVDHFLREADLVFCLGASLMVSLAATPIPTGKTIVHCTADAGDLSTEHRTPHAVIGDIKLVLRQLIDEIERQGGRPDGGAAAAVKTVRDAWLAQWMPKLTSEEVPLNPYSRRVGSHEHDRPRECDRHPRFGHAARADGAVLSRPAAAQLSRLGQRASVGLVARLDHGCEGRRAGKACHCLHGGRRIRHVRDGSRNCRARAHSGPRDRDEQFVDVDVFQAHPERDRALQGRAHVGEL